jgi:bifunctional DNA-binding transcriptional regulator/antitoxin component of YhaV-PrlF toxin-antitoxin module
MKENIVLKLDEKGRLTLPLKLRRDYNIELAMFSLSNQKKQEFTWRRQRIHSIF